MVPATRPETFATGHCRRPAAPGHGLFATICAQLRRCDDPHFEPLLQLAVEIAREGREGRRIGTVFTFGDSDAVLARSRALILDPLTGHALERKRITDPNLRGTIKELAQLDGAFVVSCEGHVVAACRYLNALATEVDLPYGVGSRHLAGASISAVTKAVAIVVSESAIVRLFENGRLVAEIIPEVWLLRQQEMPVDACCNRRARSNDVFLPAAGTTSERPSPLVPEER